MTATSNSWGAGRAAQFHLQQFGNVVPGIERKHLPSCGLETGANQLGFGDEVQGIVVFAVEDDADIGQQIERRLEWPLSFLAPLARALDLPNSV